MATEHELHKMRYDRSAESMSEKIVENCEIIRENELTHEKTCYINKKLWLFLPETTGIGNPVQGLL